GGGYTIESSHFMEIAASGFKMDTSGTFSFVSAPGYLTFSMPGFTATPPYPVTKNFSLISTGATVLEGTLTDRNTGQPIAGAAIRICNATFESCSSQLSTSTDSNGHYALSGAQAGATQGRIRFQAQGYFATQQPFNITTAPIEVDASAIVGGPVLQGTVTDSITGQGVFGATVSFESDSSLVPADGAITSTITAVTGAGGTYTIDSSHFMEIAATGFKLDASGTFAFVSAAGYLTLPTPGFVATPPYPITTNYSLIPNGTENAITIATAPAGLTINVDGSDYTEPTTFAWPTQSVHTLAVMSPQGSAGTRQVFSNWSDSGAQSHRVTIAGPASYTASFKTQYQLTTSASPAADGSITAGGWFDAGTSVSILATPATGFALSSFSGDLTGSTNPQTLVMDSPKNVIANFTASTVSTVTTISSSTNPTVWGQSVTFTAAVTASIGVPTGTVTFSDGNVPIGTVSLNGTGQAGLITSALSQGTHSISAVFNGSANYLTSSSSALAQVVNKASTQISLT